jgi:hypothetical protein
MIVYLAFFCGAAVVGVPMLIWLSWSGRLYTKVGTPYTSHNKQSVQCQHSFYAVRFAGIVRCNKCNAEFPLISTC